MEPNNRTAEMNVNHFISSLEGALDYFKANYHTIDNLNVFPVPDGDTGVNMLLTLEPAVEAILKAPMQDYETILELLQDVTTINSRGNSGFILSRFFSGFSETVRKYARITPEILTEAFLHGHYVSKTAISTPMEGTMLSVFEAIARAMSETRSDSVIQHLELAVRTGRDEVFRSPEKLPVLKKAGVVDSGALGFVFIIEGMRRRLTGETVTIEKEADFRFEPDADSNLEELMVLSNRYCTELTIQRSGDTPKNGLETYLNEVGDSVALLVNDEIIKLHVHTNTPDEVIAELSRYGVILNKKVEDMQKQIEEEFARFQHENEIGVLALVPGEGFRTILHDFEPDLDVLVYGKNLPKTGDILNHINQMPYDDIIVLANDKNIIPAVQLVRNSTPKHVEIFPSKNIIQGVAAIMGFVKNLSWQENLTQMTSSMELVDSISVYKSVKDSQFAGIHIPVGHYFAVMKGNVTAVSPAFDETVLNAIRKADPDERTVISLYYNDQVGEDALNGITAVLADEFEEIDVDVRFGGQHTALLLIGLE
ncbi:MAG: DAK2 domain-containing protein [Candidatus Marinimicrobia bacterium]|nr:DAK2 domain-containing protein [Candidatus Neomarinimicrobiota bacterium]